MKLIVDHEAHPEAEREPDHKIVSNESAQASVRVMGTVLFGIGLAIAYWVWPTGITDVTLANIAFGRLLQAIASGGIVVITFYLAALLWMD